MNMRIDLIPWEIEDERGLIGLINGPNKDPKSGTKKGIHFGFEDRNGECGWEGLNILCIGRDSVLSAWICGAPCGSSVAW